MNAQSLVGQTLDDKYSIRREIGRGGMGAVYLAVHLGTKRSVAVKVIVPQFMRSGEFVERFRREAEAAGRLHHPNVVDVTDFGFAETASGRVAYLVMEYLDGCTLGEILAEEKKLPLAWTVDILEQVCLAVSEAHRQGVVHRDLKPDNIWLAPNERGGYTVKVLDFGIARLEAQTDEFDYSTVERNRTTNDAAAIDSRFDDEAATRNFPENDGRLIANRYETFVETVEEKSVSSSLDSPTLPANFASDAPSPQFETLEDLKATEINPNAFETDDNNLYEKTTDELTRAGAIMGTPLYMSPEQCRSERIGTASDIYSLGVVAYQMLAGKTPFEGDYVAVSSAHLQLPPPLLTGKIPRAIKRVVFKALSKEPKMRPPSAEVFSSQLRSHSENIFTIFRRALVIYIENFSKLIRFSLLLYFPTILLGGAAFFVAVMKFDGFFAGDFAARISIALLSLIKHFNIAAGVAAETLITGAVAWIVVRYIDAPLRSFRVRGALEALFEKRGQFAWIIALRVLINLFVQGDLTAFSVPTVFILSCAETFVFWSLPCVVMMESTSGIAVFERARQLTAKVLPTVSAAILLNLLIFLTVGVSATIIVLSLAAFLAQNFLPHVSALPWDDFARLFEGAVIASIKFVGVLLLPFFGVVTVLVYLKSRHAGGESLKSLLDQFKTSNVVQSNWQKRIRRRIEQSRKSSKDVRNVADGGRL